MGLFDTPAMKHFASACKWPMARANEFVSAYRARAEDVQMQEREAGGSGGVPPVMPPYWRTPLRTDAF